MKFPPWLSRFFPLVLFVAVSLASVFLFLQFRQREEDIARQLVEAVAHDARRLLTLGLQDKVAGLHRMAHRAQADLYPDEDAWRADAALYTLHENFAALAWIDSAGEIHSVVRRQAGPTIARSELDRILAEYDFSALGYDDTPKIIGPYPMDDQGRAIGVVVPMAAQSGIVRGTLLGFLPVREVFENILVNVSPEYGLSATLRGVPVYERHPTEGVGAGAVAVQEPTEIFGAPVGLTLWPTQNVFSDTQTLPSFSILIAGLLMAELIAVAAMLAQSSMRREKALLEADEWSRLVLSTSREAYVAMDEDGLVTDWNPQAEKILGWSRAQALDEPLADLIIPPEYRELHWKGLRKFLETGEGPVLGKRIEVSALHRDGHAIPVELIIYPLKRDDHYLFNGFIHDISGRKRQEAELRRSNAELAQFAYVASHDLQEPLRMVVSYMQLLERRHGNQLSGEAREFVVYAVDGAQRMQRLISDLLEYSRINTRARPFEPVDMNALVADVTKNFQASLEEARGRLEVDSLPVMEAEPTQMRQLFQNLISNAIKYRGENPPVIQISAEEKEEEWVFSVADNGIGFDPSYKEKVFQVFQRLHTRTDYEGSGIGLAVCKKIVERHGGKIDVQTAPGHGARFIIHLPKNPALYGAQPVS